MENKDRWLLRPTSVYKTSKLGSNKFVYNAVRPYLTIWKPVKQLQKFLPDFWGTRKWHVGRPEILVVLQ